MGTLNLQTIVRVLVTAVIIVAVSQIARYSRWMGAIIVSLPLTSLLVLAWLYYDTRDVKPVAELSMSIFWAVIPSLAFFPVFAVLLKHYQLSFVLALVISCLVTAAVYYGFFALLKVVGIGTN